MRVLVLEQEHAGHHYHYLFYILPKLADLVDEVVVAVTPYGFESTEFRHLLSPLADRVTFEPVLPPGDPGLSAKGRLRLLRTLRDTIRRVKPDYTLVPSGDGQVSAMALYRASGQKGLPGNADAEVGIHYSYGFSSWKTHRKNVVKDLLYYYTQKYSSFRKIHYVNMLYYEWVISRGGSVARRAELMPHPVSDTPRLSKQEGRLGLGLPEDGRYLGILAVLDTRKAIPQLLAAFRSVAGPNDRLLLAGCLNADFLRIVETEYSDLLEEKRIILFNHFIDSKDVPLILASLDVVVVPYPHFGALSSAMLQGLGAGRPVLVNDFGWMRAMMRRFEFGWRCDVLDHDAFSRTIATALEESPSYVESEATQRLLEFHAPENFTNYWLKGVREKLGLPPVEGLKTWSWVLEKLPEERRALR